MKTNCVTGDEAEGGGDSHGRSTRRQYQQQQSLAPRKTQYEIRIIDVHNMHLFTKPYHTYNEFLQGGRSPHGSISPTHNIALSADSATYVPCVVRLPFLTPLCRRRPPTKTRYVRRPRHTIQRKPKTKTPPTGSAERSLSGRRRSNETRGTVQQRNSRQLHKRCAHAGTIHSTRSNIRNQVPTLSSRRSRASPTLLAYRTRRIRLITTTKKTLKTWTTTETAALRMTLSRLMTSN